MLTVTKKSKKDAGKCNVCKLEQNYLLVWEIDFGVIRVRVCKDCKTDLIHKLKAAK